LKKCKTNKLFWDEHPYKLVVRNRIAPIFRNRNLSHARQVLDNLQSCFIEGKPLYLRRGNRKDSIADDQFQDAKKLLHFFSKHDDYRLRVEYTSLSIYATDHHWLMQISKSLNQHSVAEFWEPESNILQHLEKNVIILDEKINYNYKVTLGNRKGNSGFAAFSKTNPHLVRVGPVLMKELETAGYVSGMYFYARDEKTIQLCQLILDNIRRIDKIIYKQDIDK
jgi:hypothetical protein